VAVRASGGTVHAVTVRSAGGQAVAGTLSADHRSWHSSWTLAVSAQYSVTATAVNAAGKTVTKTSSFRTLAPTNTFQIKISEGYRQTYGVGMPVQLTFSQPITDKAAVQRSLQLTSSKPVVGAWSWIDDEHVDFRPREYWPANTRVSFDGHLNGVQGAPGVYGAADLTQSFSIGASLIVVASTATHHMQVYADGKLRYDWPISTGTPGDDTPNGTYLTIDKGNPVEMKPDDIAPGQPGYYDLQVPWSVRFTWSGDFLHDAYWSVGQQGSTNVSHGCVNMPPADAQLYYTMELPGDPVTITGSPAAGKAGDGWTDWFESWAQWAQGSALHQAVRVGAAGSTPAAAAPSGATAPLGTAAPNNFVAS
jgi:lipoprotein-anchoring transpeptidase ErfK/SrfK